MESELLCWSSSRIPDVLWGHPEVKEREKTTKSLEGPASDPHAWAQGDARQPLCPPLAHGKGALDPSSLRSTGTGRRDSGP